MASRGSIPKMMELAGIDMLPPEHGVPAVRRELTAAGPGGEVVVAGALGVLLEERHPTGGLDLERASPPHGPMAGRIAAMTGRRRASRSSPSSTLPTRRSSTTTASRAPRSCRA